MRQRRSHAAGERLIARVGAARVHPDDAVGEAPQAGHLLSEHAGVVPFPTVGHHDDDSAPRHASTAVGIEERLHRLADAGAALPVGRRRRRPPQRRLDVAIGERPREAREPRREGEDLRPGGPRDGGSGVQEVNVGEGVGLHRAGDVADHHEAARDAPRAAPDEPHGVAGASVTPPQRRSQVDDVTTVVATGTPARAERQGEVDAVEQAAQLGEVVSFELGEIPAAPGAPRGWPC